MAFYSYLSTKIIIMTFITKSYQNLFGVRSYINAINKKGIFSKCPYKQKPEEENLLFLLPVLFVSFLSSYFPSISFNSSSTAAFNCVSSPFTTVSGELATLISGSNCEFSR